MNVCYILRCADGSLYTGWTNDLEERVRTHNAGKGGKYTRARLPVELVYYEQYPTKAEAMRREWHLKRLPRAKKLRLIESGGEARPHACADEMLIKEERHGTKTL